MSKKLAMKETIIKLSFKFDLIILGIDEYKIHLLHSFNGFPHIHGINACSEYTK